MGPGGPGGMGPGGPGGPGGGSNGGPPDSLIDNIKTSPANGPGTPRDDGGGSNSGGGPGGNGGPGGSGPPGPGGSGGNGGGGGGMGEFGGMGYGGPSGGPGSGPGSGGPGGPPGGPGGNGEVVRVVVILSLAITFMRNRFVFPPLGASGIGGHFENKREHAGGSEEVREIGRTPGFLLNARSLAQQNPTIQIQERRKRSQTA